MRNILLMLIMFTLTILLGGCASAPPYHTVIAENFKAHNLNLTYSKTTFNEKELRIEGGIRTITAPSRVDCGYISIQVFNQHEVLLKTLATEYSPCILHFRPKARRTGIFSATVDNIEPQPLIIKFNYRKKISFIN